MLENGITSTLENFHFIQVLLASQYKWFYLPSNKMTFITDYSRYLYSLYAERKEDEDDDDDEFDDDDDEGDKDEEEREDDEVLLVRWKWLTRN